MTRRQFAIGQLWQTRGGDRFRITGLGPRKYPYLVGFLNGDEVTKQTLAPDGRFVAVPVEGKKKERHPLDLVVLVLTDC